jgi:hypothetical protein
MNLLIDLIVLLIIVFCVALICGQVFLDVNGPDLPNKLGIDQYIVSLTLDGIR